MGEALSYFKHFFFFLLWKLLALQVESEIQKFGQVLLVCTLEVKTVSSELH